MKKYLIFDLDGTLIDSGSKIDTIILGEIDRIAPDYHDSVRYALGHSGGMSLSQFLDSVFQDMEVVQKERLKNKLLIQLNSLSNAVGFFP
ncbi:MAG: hypothetical protein H6767_00320 [Candidatus Peribacteria bacterium]|nr:MAG: hypothetical protein H6767_00320 [Candidatus Peribacteria bacterium]